MAPRKSSADKLAEAIELLKANRVTGAMRILEKLQEKEAAKAAKKKSASKRAPSAYNIFMKKKYAELHAANPKMAAKDIMKLIAAAWKEENGVVKSSPAKAAKKTAKKAAPKKEKAPAAKKAAKKTTKKAAKKTA